MERVYNLIENSGDDSVLNSKNPKKDKNFLMQINSNFTTARTFLTSNIKEDYQTE